MNTVQTWQTHTTSAEQTEQLAEKLGANLRGGEVIELVSDLGGGKTTFTRGLVRGAGSQDRVASPTFTIGREYDTRKFTIAHFDFYRLETAGIVANELAEVMANKQYVTIIEWGDIVHDILPENRLTIRIDQVGEHERQITVGYTEPLRYALAAIIA